MSERTEFTGKAEPRRSNKFLHQLLPMDTLMRAGFNYDEGSLLIERPEGGLLRAYISDGNEWSGRPSIVILENRRQQGTVAWRDWYFGTIGGEPLGKRRGDEVEVYYQELDRIYAEGKIRGAELESQVLQVLEEHDEYKN